MGDRSAVGAGSGKRRRVPTSGAWVALFALAVALRAGATILAPPPLDGDQSLYLHLADSTARGNGYVLDQAPKTTVHPLLPVVHAALIRLGADPRTGGIALTVLIGAMVPVVGGMATASVLGRVYGLVAGFLLAVQPHHVLRSGALEPDLLAALLGFWVAWSLWRRRLLLVGTLLGLAYLNRPEAVLLVPCAAWIAWRRGTGWAGMAPLVVPFAVLAAVFLLFVHAWSTSARIPFAVRVVPPASASSPRSARLPEARACARWYNRPPMRRGPAEHDRPLSAR